MGRSESKFARWARGILRSGKAREELRYVVRNRTQQTEIGGRIEVAGDAARRKKGLLGRTGLDPGEGLWIVPCEAVHTFGMKFDLDLIYLDRSKRVLKVRAQVGRSRLSACFRAHSVIELPAGTIDATRTQRGDILEFEPVPAPAAGA